MRTIILVIVTWVIAFSLIMFGYHLGKTDTIEKSYLSECSNSHAVISFDGEEKCYIADWQ